MGDPLAAMIFSKAFLNAISESVKKTLSEYMRGAYRLPRFDILHGPLQGQ
jgi:hypothetical protein